MCSPAMASLGVQAAGAVSSGAGAMFSASAQKMGLKLDATIAGINADKARDNARETLREGYQSEVQTRLQTGMLKSRERAAMGANGVDLTTGSALDRQVSTDWMGEADAQTIRLNAMRAAMGYRDEATNYDMKATIARGQAKGISPFLTGATSLLGSASQIAGSWYGMKEAGMFGQSGGGGSSPGFDPSKSVSLNMSGGDKSLFQGEGFKLGTIGPSTSSSWLDRNMPIGVSTPFGIRY